MDNLLSYLGGYNFCVFVRLSPHLTSQFDAPNRSQTPRGESHFNTDQKIIPQTNGRNTREISIDHASNGHFKGAHRFLLFDVSH